MAQRRRVPNPGNSMSGAGTIRQRTELRSRGADSMTDAQLLRQARSNARQRQARSETKLTEVQRDVLAMRDARRRARGR